MTHLCISPSRQTQTFATNLNSAAFRPPVPNLSYCFSISYISFSPVPDGLLLSLIRQNDTQLHRKYEMASVVFSKNLLSFNLAALDGRKEYVPSCCRYFIYRTKTCFSGGRKEGVSTHKERDKTWLLKGTVSCIFKAQFIAKFSKI